MSALNVAMFGLGEAGALMAKDLVDAKVQVTAFDPANVATPAGVIRANTPHEAVATSDLVIALTAGDDALTAMEQALEDIPTGAIYADFSTNSVAIKQQLAARAASRQLHFVDVALMSIVPGKGIRTPVMVAGTGARSFALIFAEFAMPVEVVAGEAGAAAERKLLRSVMMKGLAAVIIEAMRGAEAAGCSEWLWGNITAELASADEALITRLVAGTATHAKRRLHEMQCTEALLRTLALEPVMTHATVESLQQVLAQGIPVIPAQ
ncbi:NAD(P)-binding domain-containing protein [Dasania marina]|uniref:NAD(P)-dependent oxidoreductase n=1 Tax=Dasania marina TaxID=471499 RepID=UPI0030D791A7